MPRGKNAPPLSVWHAFSTIAGRIRACEPFELYNDERQRHESARTIAGYIR